MNIKEIGRHIKQEFIHELVDPWKSIDSRPEHLAAFPAHLDGCSRTKPLNLTFDIVPMPSFNSANFHSKLIRRTCSECGGAEEINK